MELVPGSALRSLQGATTLSLMAFSRTTQHDGYIATLSITFSITLMTNALLTAMLSVVMVNVIMLGVVFLNVIMLSVITQNVAMLSVIMW